MILKPSDILKKFSKSNKFYLFYGVNNGFIEDTINLDLKQRLSKNIYNYDENEIIAKTNEFRENVLNNSFFDIDKLIIINRGTDKILKIIEEFILKDIEDTVIIIKSNVLGKNSKLRSFFEKNKNTICVPFYEDNYKTLLTIAQNFFSKKKIKISIQNINYIIEKSKKNRINLKNELEKIEIFYKKNSSIEYKDISILTNLSQNYDASELADECLLKNKKKTTFILNENISSQEDNINLLRSFLFKLKRLKKLKTEIEKRKNVDQVILSFKPTIFWKDKEIIKKQLEILTLKDIKIFIKKINQVELEIKQNSNFSNIITNNLILNAISSTNSSI